MIDADVLIGKFEAVNVSAVSVISDEDRARCEQMQEEYDKAIEFARAYLAFLDKHPVNNDYLKTSSLAKKMQEEIEDAKKVFITTVVYYFQRRYQVNVSSHNIERVTGAGLRYETIVEGIVAQLDGMNFYEKAVFDLKDRLHRHFGRWKEISVKGAKVTIADYLYFEDTWNRKGWSSLSYSAMETLRDLLTAVSNFESGATQCHYDLDSLVRQLHTDTPNSDMFREYDFTHKNKLQAFRPYKNRKVELKFVDAETAVAFAREYLKYTGE